MTSDNIAVIADIGGTNTRFATVNPAGDITNILSIKTADYTSMIDAYNDYLTKAELTKTPPTVGFFAVACPVIDDEIKLSNASWSFSMTEGGDALGMDYFSLVNDFVAQALAIPTLEEQEIVKIGGGHAVDACPIAVLGAGTGLGVSCLVPVDDDYIAIPTEGGHTTAVGLTDKENQVIKYLQKEFNHVSFERLVSGSGLENIYKALSFINTGTEPQQDSVSIFNMAEQGDALAKETFSMFFAFLGITAGNTALTYGALGGVYLSGGILNNPSVIKMLQESEFRKYFEEKGRFKEYLQNISTMVVKAENCGLLGLRNMVVDFFKKSSC